MTDSPAASSCQLDAASSVTTVAVCAHRKVCYEFDTRATNADLAIPYVVIVNGKAQGPDKPRRLSASNRKITLTAEAGSKVALYLNSDVHPDFRRNPVYAVDVGDHDVLVKITEIKGRFSHIKASPEPATLRPSSQPDSPPLACHEASLTGDIWMSISHRYSEAEALALLPNDIALTVREAVLSIYRGLGTAKLQISFQADSKASAAKLVVHFDSARNAEKNITYCSLLNDVLPRTHPSAFAALFSESCKIGVTDMLITSSWRPMYGSILHRAGLGLDVAYVANTEGKILINREGLKQKGPSSNANISSREKELFNDYQARKKEMAGSSGNKNLAQAENEALKSWENEVEKAEPKLMHELRESLRKHQSVKQIFDPWYMETKITAHGSPTTNKQQSSNENVHTDHLHITVREPQIYE